MKLVNSSQIKSYAQRNTSPKIEMESKMVEAYVDAILNSDSIIDKYRILKDIMMNGDSFVFFHSVDEKASLLNKSSYRSIIAYSMLRKDITLFELVSQSIFTGIVREYIGSLSGINPTVTDDEDSTDTGHTTDPSQGNEIIVFENIFCDNPLSTGEGSEFQTYEELNDPNRQKDFDNLIELVKPVRVGIYQFQVPYCYLGNKSGSTSRINIKASEGTIFTNFPTSVKTIKSEGNDSWFNHILIFKKFTYESEDPSVTCEDTTVDITRNSSGDVTKVRYRYNLRAKSDNSFLTKGFFEFDSDDFAVTNRISVGNLLMHPTDVSKAYSPMSDYIYIVFDLEFYVS